MDVIKTGEDALSLGELLVNAIEAAVNAGGGLLAEGESIFENVVKNPAVVTALEAVIADVKAFKS